MGNEKNYIKWLRNKVGHEKIILNFAGGSLYCDKEETLELKYFSLNSMPELFCKQHEDILCDIKNRKLNMINKKTES